LIVPNFQNKKEGFRKLKTACFGSFVSIPRSVIEQACSVV
jgi:hypothetical protein